MIAVAVQAMVDAAVAGVAFTVSPRTGDRSVVAINAIHLDRLPQMDYERLWWERELRGVANFTRQDAAEFLDLAASIPIRTGIETFALQDANEALQALKGGRLGRTAVLLAQ